MVSSTELKIGATVKIPPVSGLIYKVESGDSMSSIAAEYSVDASKIQAQNDILDGKLKQ
jgi:LysM repeat protein